MNVVTNLRKNKFYIAIGAILFGAILFNSNIEIAVGQPIQQASKLEGEQGKDLYPFVLQPLPYATDALEPYIDQETMELHHGKHLQTYIDNLNAALEKYPKYQLWNLEKLLTNLKKLPVEIRESVRNNGGGVYNHNIFFNGMAKDTTLNDGPLMQAINETYGSLDKMKEELKEAGLAQFGSGWAWLVSDNDGTLSIQRTPNQDTLLKEELTPILALDVWEHAYYLLYQNRRTDYVDNWFNVINWSVAEENYSKAMQ